MKSSSMKKMFSYIYRHTNGEEEACDKARDKCQQQQKRGSYTLG